MLFNQTGCERLRITSFHCGDQHVHDVLQVSRDVTSSVLDAIDVASVSLARHLDDGQASLTVETSSFTVTASRQQAVDVGGSFVGRPGEGVALPRYLPLVNSTADVILTVQSARQTFKRCLWI